MIINNKQIAHVLHYPPPHANSFIIGTAVINTVQTSPHRVHTGLVVYRSKCPSLSPSPHDAPVHRKDLTSLQSPKRPKLFHIRVH